VTNPIRLYNNVINFQGYDVACIDNNVPTQIVNEFKELLLGTGPKGYISNVNPPNGSQPTASSAAMEEDL